MEQLLLDHAGNDASKWAKIVSIISHLTPNAHQNATTLITQHIKAIAQHPDSNKLWATLREVLNRHRSIPEAEWAMSSADLAPLDAIYQELTPSDPTTAYGWLFDHWPNPPEGILDMGDEAHFTKINTDRQTAIVKAYQIGGTDAVLSIASIAQKPEEVGRAFVEGCGTDPAIALAISRSGINNQNYWQMIHGIFWSIYRQYGWDMLEEIIERIKDADAHPQALSAIYLAAPAEKETWQRLNNEAPAVQNCYWEQMSPYLASRNDETEIGFVAQKLLAARRSPAVAQWIARKAVHHEIVIQTLEQLPQDLAYRAVQGLNTGAFKLALVDMLKQLDESNDVDDDTIAHLELPFISVLDSDTRPNPAIYRKIANEPSLFADLVALAYKRGDGESSVAYNRQTTPLSTEILAQINFGKGDIPGKTKDGAVDHESLLFWVNEARHLCDERGQAQVGDIFIGHLLAKSPTGQDEIWPCEAVRELLEKIGSQYIGDGFVTGTKNLRGVTSRAVFTGGDQERSLMEEYRKQANMIGTRWPRTASLLRRVADLYQQDAQWFDQEAEERDQFGD